MNKTLAYYNQNADIFIEGTLNADMSEQYRFFLKHLSPNGKLLDLGCGSGRDSAYFNSLGYDVIAVDGSEELCKRVATNYGIDVHCMSFEEISFTAEFDAIWACASLLHVPKVDMPTIMNKVSTALKHGGVLYASFKYGSSEHIVDGRFFNNYTERDIYTLLTPQNHLVLREYRITKDVRPERSDEQWLNIIAKKIP